MSFYHKNFSHNYTYLKRTKEEIPSLTPKEAVNLFFGHENTGKPQQDDYCLDTLIS